MRKYISVLMALCTVFLLSVGAQARVLKSRIPESRGVAADGIVIKGEKIKFYLYAPLDGKVQIMMPRLFDVPQEIIDIMIPYESQPQFVSSREDNYDVHITIMHENIPMETKGLEDFMEKQKKIWKRLDPDAVFYNTRTEKLETTICWTDFKGHNNAGEVYSLYAFFVLDGKLAEVNFQCPFKFKDEWEPVAQTALPTLRVIPVEDRK